MAKEIRVATIQGKPARITMQTRASIEDVPADTFLVWDGLRVNLDNLSSRSRKALPAAYGGLQASESERFTENPFPYTRIAEWHRRRAAALRGEKCP